MFIVTSKVWVTERFYSRARCSVSAYAFCGVPSALIGPTHVEHASAGGSTSLAFAAQPPDERPDRDAVDVHDGVTQVDLARLRPMESRAAVQPRRCRGTREVRPRSRASAPRLGVGIRSPAWRAYSLASLLPVFSGMMAPVRISARIVSSPARRSSRETSVAPMGRSPDRARMMSRSKSLLPVSAERVVHRAPRA